MINIFEVNETNKMIEQENLDVRTITLGISLLDCIDSDLEKLNEKIYNKITTYAKDLVATGEKISAQYGIPIVNKRISVTPIGLVGGSGDTELELSLAYVDLNEIVISTVDDLAGAVVYASEDVSVGVGELNIFFAALELCAVML